MTAPDGLVRKVVVPVARCRVPRNTIECSDHRELHRAHAWPSRPRVDPERDAPEDLSVAEVDGPDTLEGGAPIRVQVATGDVALDAHDRQPEDLEHHR